MDAENQSSKGTQPVEESSRSSTATDSGTTKAKVLSIVGEVVFAGAVATGIWVFGEHLSSHNHPKLGTVCNYLACITYCATVPLVILNRWPRPKIVWSYFGGFCALVAAGFVFSSRSATPEHSNPKANLRLVLELPDFQNKRIELTNDILKFSSAKLPKADVVVPSLAVDKPPKLQFLVFNDSDFATERMMATFLLFKEGEYDAPGWSEFKRGNESYSRSVAFWIDPILSKNGEALPLIQLKPTETFSNGAGVACSVQIMPKDRNDYFINFWILPLADTNFTEPRFVIPTNNAVFVPYTIKAP